ncbi:hypothetical protein [Thermodesulfatator atlanticus]|uniref:hypothetical protein n=1 Tax=Thermodesulfatator atlanticus TaxID=501497 RepID=UPI0003B38AD2|nr:hypothetical protein [Thermodesulfatator atlanticus]
MPQVNLDCEGPLTLNDNAFELCQKFIPHGDKFFAIISKYDDYLADIEKRPGYKAGDTLKLVLPFLKAYGVTNDIMREFSKKTLKVLPKAIEFLRYASKNWPTFIISTSYCPYLEALCEISGFPRENVFCTEVDMEKISLSTQEISFLEKLAQQIAILPSLEIPHHAKEFSDLSEESQKAILRLEEIFWKILPELKAGVFLREVNPIGGPEKARAVRESLEKTGLFAEEVLYIGDSITDVEAFQLVKEAKGGSISFNGNRYALKAAEFYALSENASAHACLARLFAEAGRDGLFLAAEKKVFKTCEKLPPELSPQEFSFGIVFREDFEDLVAKSESFRKNVRGEAIGALG